jgi:hypothetical protein
MNAAPPAFRSELRAHNRHAIGAGLISLVGAILAWNLAYFFFVLILLGLVTAAKGDFGPATPRWIPGTALALAIGLLLWGVVDAVRRRFAPPSDRAIIGWHLIPDFLLLPVRVTFAIWGNFTAVRRLSPHEIDRAWELLVAIHRAGNAPISTLTVIEPDFSTLHRLLGTLQMLGFIDLHKGEQDWFYAVCSPREAELRALTSGE